MSSMAKIEEFLSQPSVALIGMSRSGKKFGNFAYRALVAKGYRVTCNTRSRGSRDQTRVVAAGIGIAGSPERVRADGARCDLGRVHFDVRPPNGLSQSTPLGLGASGQAAGIEKEEL